MKKPSSRRRRIQFSLRTLLFASAVVALYLGMVPRFQNAREAWRRSRLHFQLGPKIYGYHGVCCQPCRRQMADAIIDESESPIARVAWIRELARQPTMVKHLQASLRRASNSANPDVAVAAEDALRKLERRR